MTLWDLFRICFFIVVLFFFAGTARSAWAQSGGTSATDFSSSTVSVIGADDETANESFGQMYGRSGVRLITGSVLTPFGAALIVLGGVILGDYSGGDSGYLTELANAVSLAGVLSISIGVITLLAGVILIINGASRVRRMRRRVERSDYLISSSTHPSIPS